MTTEISVMYGSEKVNATACYARILGAFRAQSIQIYSLSVHKDSILCMVVARGSVFDLTLPMLQLCCNVALQYHRILLTIFKRLP